MNLLLIDRENRQKFQITDYETLYYHFDLYIIFILFLIRSFEFSSFSNSILTIFLYLNNNGK